MKKIYLIIFVLLLITPFSFARSLSINNYDIYYNLNEDGVINISEKIEYSTKGCYSELYLTKPTSLKILNASGFCENKSCDFRHDLTNTPTGEQELVLKSTYCNQDVNVIFNYDVINVINQLQDGNFQFYYFLYGMDTAYSTNLSLSLTIPKDFENTEYFIHSKDYNLEVIENQMLIFKKVLPYEPIEINLLMPSNYFTKTEYINQDNLTSTQVKQLEENWEKEYNKYIRQNVLLISNKLQYIISIIIILSIIIFLFIVWKKHGRELSREEVSFFEEYQRELPYKDQDPILANYFLNEKFTKYWFSSAIMYLVWKGLYLLEKENDDYFLLRTEKEIELSNEIKKIDDFLKKHFKNEKFNVKEIERRIKNRISLKDNLIDQLKRNQEFQIDFRSLYKQISSSQLAFERNKKYYENKGKKIFGFFVFGYAFFFMLISIIFGNTIRVFLSINFIFLVLILILLVVSYRHFGKFTKEGRIINLKWQGFKRYITDFSDIKNHPPKHVILWEEFLVYATAFGVAKKVIKNIKTLMPQEYNNTRIVLYSGFVISNSFSNLNSISSSGGSGGGFGGGAGGGGAGGR